MRNVAQSPANGGGMGILTHELPGGRFIDFSQQYLRAALIVSLMSVWMLVGLFYYLNHYTKRDYFTIWTAAWLFYSLWLTLGLKFEDTAPESDAFKLKQCCVAISAVFLLWGSLRFLKIPVRQTLFGLFMLFLLVWTCVGPYFISESAESQDEKVGHANAGLHSARLQQRVRRRLFFPAAQKNAVCGRGHAGGGDFFSGVCISRAIRCRSRRAPFQRRFFCGGGAAALHRRQHDRAGAGGNRY